jgi:hypothetical protein
VFGSSSTSLVWKPTSPQTGLGVNIRAPMNAVFVETKCYVKCLGNLACCKGAETLEVARVPPQDPPQLLSGHRSSGPPAPLLLGACDELGAETFVEATAVLQRMGHLTGMPPG